jgi:hypothetical protein
MHCPPDGTFLRRQERQSTRSGLAHGGLNSLRGPVLVRQSRQRALPSNALWKEPSAMARIGMTLLKQLKEGNNIAELVRSAATTSVAVLGIGTG